MTRHWSHARRKPDSKGIRPAPVHTGTERETGQQVNGPRTGARRQARGERRENADEHEYAAAAA